MVKIAEPSRAVCAWCGNIPDLVVEKKKHFDGEDVCTADRCVDFQKQKTFSAQRKIRLRPESNTRALF